jgi:flagellar hook-associated protein 2
VNGADASINSGSLNLQVIGAGTKLASLNNGEGVGSGSFLITDSAGNFGAVNLTVAGATTIGDVINEINSLSIQVEARINDTGDGILLVDQAGGTQTLTVADVGNGRVAERLKLAGTAVEVDIEGTPTQVIDGSTAIEVDIDDDDTLADMVEKINELGAGVTAGVISTGIGDNPHRLSLLSEVPGRAGALLVESSNDSLKFQEVVAAQDSLLLFGSPDSQGAGVLLSSNSNTFEEVVPGLTATINGTSQQAVNVSVTGSDKSLVSGVTQLVSAYNRLRDKLTESTFFNAAENTTGVLFGSNEALRVDSDMSRLFSGRIAGVGELQSLESVGIRLGENGKLTLDQEQLQAAFAENPQAVRELFVTEELGFVDRLDKVVEALAGEENSLLVNRSRTLNNKTESNADRIAFFNERLSRQRERLLLEFFRLEQTIGKMQTAIDSIGQIQALPPLHVTPAS